MIQILAANETTLRLGRQGEHLARQVVFDLSGWIDTYGDGVPELICLRPGDDAPHPVAYDRDGSTLVWTVTSAYTVSVDAYGQCELRWYVNEVIVKSRTWRTWVEPAMDTPTGDIPPDPQQGWVEQVLAAGAAANASAERAKSAAERAESAVPSGSLVIGNGLKWDPDGNLSVDTADSAEQDNTRPITSAAVYMEIGNIDAILKTI